LARETSGIIATLASRRPLLSTTMAAFALTALAVAGVRNSGASLGDRTLITSFIFNAFVIIGAPAMVAAVAPRALAPRVFALGLATAVVVLLVMNNDRHWFTPGFADLPGTPALLAALGLMFYFAALAPVIGGSMALSVAGPFAAILGAAGAAGFFAMEGVLGTPGGGAALGLGLGMGAALGASIGADHARYFAAGAHTKHAAAGAAHEAIAPVMFSIMVMVAVFAVQSLSANFGALDWPMVTAAFIVAVATGVTVLFAVSGSLADARLSEVTATNENLRRRWFIRAWRPARMALPASTAFAVSAIAGIFAAIAFFESALPAPLSYLFFLVLIWAAAAIIFVSLRTSLLILALLMMSGLLSNLVFDIVGLVRPAMLESLAAFALTAVALGQLTVSWRDAGGQWRNARDIAENAMSDGLQRYLVTLGYGAAALFTAEISGAWSGGGAAAVYFICAASINLVLGPAFMTAMSARYQSY